MSTRAPTAYLEDCKINTKNGLGFGWVPRFLLFLISRCPISIFHTVVREYKRSRGPGQVGDELVTKVATILEVYFGVPEWDNLRRIWTYRPCHTNDRNWQKQIATHIQTDLSVFGRQLPMDLAASDTITTLDGWTLDSASRTWRRNTLRDCRLRVLGKTRAELTNISSSHYDAIASLWTAVRDYEAQGGRSVANDDHPLAATARDAFARLLAHEDAEWFRNFHAACGEDMDVTLYLIKQGSRAIWGLRFVELLVLHGAKRSGKDTFVI